MLRAVALLLAAALIVAGLIALILGAFSPAITFGALGGMLAIGTLYERVFYKKTLSQAPGAGWQRTPERFVDPATGQPVTVYVHPVSGERQYVQE